MLPRSPQWLGRLAYPWALRLQRLRRDAVIEGRAPGVLWMLEHEPVLTTGRRGVADLPTAEVLDRHAIAVVHTERGGLATWHGPGQLVGYLVADLGQLGPRRTVEAVEEGLIGWLRVRGLDPARRCGAPGVWLGRDKVAAVGMHFRHGVTMHGFAVNLTCDLGGFGLITPCGIRDGGVTTVARAAGTAPPPRHAAGSVGRSVLEALVDTLDGAR